MQSRPLHEGVDWNHMEQMEFIMTKTSPSSRGRGLKWFRIPLQDMRPQVALFTRAWIEISRYSVIGNLYCVALFTRAWIEITSLPTVLNTVASPSSRGRGLKLWYSLHISVVSCVALFTRAWIEMLIELFLTEFIRSRPLHEGVDWNSQYNAYHTVYFTSPSSRGRGLKYKDTVKYRQWNESPSSRGRGLK